MFFTKKSKRPWTPLPRPFLEITLRFFPENPLSMRKFAMKFFGFAMTPPLSPFLDIFSKVYDQNIQLWNQQNLQCNFLDQKWLPPIGTFPKKHPYLGRQTFLMSALWLGYYQVLIIATPLNSIFWLETICCAATSKKPQQRWDAI